MNEKDPACVGLPLISPDEEMAKPAGKDPDKSDHEYGRVPPVAAKVAE
jgi:hypothetical protein